jgi:hypothetical protein
MCGSWSIPHDRDRQDVRLNLGHYKRHLLNALDDEVLDVAQRKSELALDDTEFRLWSLSSRTATSGSGRA